MKLETLHSVFFLGIGGIGMSALARWFAAKGKKVYGYDLTETPNTQSLVASGIGIQYTDKVSDLPVLFTNAKESSNILVVYTPAIPKESQLMAHFKECGFNILKRSQILGEITANIPSVAVAGTHGKTSTTAMIAHGLQHSKGDVTAFVGGMMTNYNSNLLIGSDKSWAIVEADEFDRSFLTLSPEIAIITSMDADHLDIYGNSAALRTSFLDFTTRLTQDGQLIVKHGLLENEQLRPDINCITYGINIGDVYATNIQIKESYFNFDVVGIFEIDNIKLHLQGAHNVENSIAGIAALKMLEVSDDEIRGAFDSFLGVKRRFEYIIKSNELVYIDDYAHHPVELAAFLNSVRSIYPSRKITAIFQPHLYSRTNDFHVEFGTSLDLADEVLLLDIYPARETPMEGVSSQIILNHIKKAKAKITTKETLLDDLSALGPDIVVTIGAGDIDKLVVPISTHLKKLGKYVES